MRIQGECDVLGKEMDDKIALLKVLEGEQRLLDKEKEELEKLKIIALNDNEALEKELFERQVSF